MELAYALLIAVFLLSLVVVVRGRLVPFLVTCLSLVVTAIGFLRLSSTTGLWGPAWAELGGMFLLLVGYSAGRRKRAFLGVNRRQGSSQGALVGVTLIVAGLSLLHFAVVGMPIFQPNPEVARWSFTESGLLGLPGRVVLYGVIVALLISVGLSRTREGGIQLTRVGIALGLLFLLTRLVMGFKSSLIEVVIDSVFIASTARAPASLVRAVKAFSVPIIVAVVFGVFVTMQYGTFVSSGLSLPEYLLNRATVEGALPGYLVLVRDVVPESTTTLQDDLRYYVGKYVPGFNTGGRLPFEKLVSAHITGTAPIDTNFIVPVTVGALAPLILDFGAIGFVVMLLVGVMYGRLETAAGRVHGELSYAACVVALLALDAYVTKGDPLYWLFNWSAMYVFVGGTYLAFKSLLNRASPGASREVRIASSVTSASRQ